MEKQPSGRRLMTEEDRARMLARAGMVLEKRQAQTQHAPENCKPIAIGRIKPLPPELKRKRAQSGCAAASCEKPVGTAVSSSNNSTIFGRGHKHKHKHKRRRVQLPNKQEGPETECEWELEEARPERGEDEKKKGDKNKKRRRAVRAVPGPAVRAAAGGRNYEDLKPAGITAQHVSYEYYDELQSDLFGGQHAHAADVVRECPSSNHAGAAGAAGSGFYRQEQDWDSVDGSEADENDFQQSDPLMEEIEKHALRAAPEDVTSNPFEASASSILAKKATEARREMEAEINERSSGATGRRNGKRRKTSYSPSRNSPACARRRCGDGLTVGAVRKTDEKALFSGRPAASGTGSASAAPGKKKTLAQINEEALRRDVRGSSKAKGVIPTQRVARGPGHTKGEEVLAKQNIDEERNFEAGRRARGEGEQSCPRPPCFDDKRGDGHSSATSCSARRATGTATRSSKRRTRLDKQEHQPAVATSVANTNDRDIEELYEDQRQTRLEQQIQMQQQLQINQLQLQRLQMAATWMGLGAGAMNTSMTSIPAGGLFPAGGGGGAMPMNIAGSSGCNSIISYTMNQNPPASSPTPTTSNTLPVLHPTSVDALAWQAALSGLQLSVSADEMKQNQTEKEKGGGCAAGGHDEMQQAKKSAAPATANVSDESGAPPPRVQGKSKKNRRSSEDSALELLEDLDCLTKQTKTKGAPDMRLGADEPRLKTDEANAKPKEQEEQLVEPQSQNLTTVVDEDEVAPPPIDLHAEDENEWTAAWLRSEGRFFIQEEPEPGRSGKDNEADAGRMTSVCAGVAAGDREAEDLAVDENGRTSKVPDVDAELAGAESRCKGANQQDTPSTSSSAAGTTPPTGQGEGKQEHLGEKQHEDEAEGAGAFVSPEELEFQFGRPGEEPRMKIVSNEVSYFKADDVNRVTGEPAVVRVQHFKIRMSSLLNAADAPGRGSSSSPPLADHAQKPHDSSFFDIDLSDGSCPQRAATEEEYRRQLLPFTGRRAGADENGDGQTQTHTVAVTKNKDDDDDSSELSESRISEMENVPGQVDDAEDVCVAAGDDHEQLPEQQREGVRHDVGDAKIETKSTEQVEAGPSQAQAAEPIAKRHHQSPTPSREEEDEESQRKTGIAAPDEEEDTGPRPPDGDVDLAACQQMRTEPCNAVRARPNDAEDPKKPLLADVVEGGDRSMVTTVPDADATHENAKITSTGADAEHADAEAGAGPRGASDVGRAGWNANQAQNEQAGSQKATKVPISIAQIAVDSRSEDEAADHAKDEDYKKRNKTTRMDAPGDPGSSPSMKKKSAASSYLEAAPGATGSDFSVNEREECFSADDYLRRFIEARGMADNGIHQRKTVQEAANLICDCVEMHGVDSIGDIVTLLKLKTGKL